MDAGVASANDEQPRRSRRSVAGREEQGVTQRRPDRAAQEIADE
jgi:hypothetical protein